MIRTIKQTQLLEKSITEIFTYHRISLTNTETAKLSEIWYRKLVRSETTPRCQNLIEIRRDDLLFRGFHHKNVITSYTSCENLQKRKPMKCRPSLSIK